MPYIDIVTALAILQFIIFGYKVARARGRFGVKAPATTGNEVFERHFRVQQNTLEQLVAFLPAIYVFGRYWSPLVAAGLGLVYLIGRELFAYTYVKDPAKRELGFTLTFIAVIILVLGALFGAARALFLS